MLSNNLYNAVQTEVRRKVVNHLIMKYNQLWLQYMNDNDMTEAHYRAKRDVIAEMIKSYKCYDGVKDLVEVFEETNP